jgi:hypothetical protein
MVQAYLGIKPQREGKNAPTEEEAAAYIAKMAEVAKPNG